MDLDAVKRRDKWVCKKCGHRFDSLSVLCFGDASAECDYITLCESCISWAFSNEEEAVKEFRRATTSTKVVFVGDCHNDFDRLDSVLTSEEPFDMFISVGDFATVESSIVNKWKDRGYFVKGNHDDVTLINNLGLHQELHGLTIAGLNGIIRSKNFLKDTYNNISFREIMYLSHLKGVDILVTHQAPTGVFSKMGEPVLEELLNYLVPRIYVFGHVHRFKFKFHLNTFMISLPMITNGHAVAYFQGKELRNLELVFKKGKKFVRV